MPIHERSAHRATDGQYAMIQESLSGPGKIASELMATLERDLIEKLDALGELEEEEYTTARRDIKKVFARLLSNATARNAPAVRRGSSRWNGFHADNFESARKELMLLPEDVADHTGKKIPMADVTRLIGKRWRELSPETRDNYPALGKLSGSKKRKLGEEIVPAREAWKKNKKRLIDNIQASLVELDNSYGISSLWISCTKDWAADSSFFLTNEVNPDEPMNSYYAELTGRNLNHKAASVYFKAAYGGLNVNHGTVARIPSENEKHDKREKRSDQVRREFKRTLITYYNEYAKENRKKLLGVLEDLPSGFFTKDNGWILENFPAGVHFRKLSTKQLEEAIIGLISGSIRFIPKPLITNESGNGSTAGV